MAQIKDDGTFNLYYPCNFLFACTSFSSSQCQQMIFVALMRLLCLPASSGNCSCYLIFEEMLVLPSAFSTSFCRFLRGLKWIYILFYFPKNSLLCSLCAELIIWLEDLWPELSASFLTLRSFLIVLTSIRAYVHSRCSMPIFSENIKKSAKTNLRKSKLNSVFVVFPVKASYFCL